MGATSYPKCVAIIAGETSGDQHGARVVTAMRTRHPDLFFCGIGGPALREAGVRIVLDASELTVVGITEVLSKIPAILKAMGIFKKLLRGLKPDLLILIDFPDFNLRMAATAKKLGIPVLYYISPQIWAWRPGRVKRIGKLVDHMAVILPFEERFYKEHGVAVTFVGHPLLDFQLPAPAEIIGNRIKDGLIIGLLPGSRDNEIRQHLPVMLAAADILKARLKNVKFKISHAPSVDRNRIERLVGTHRQREEFEVVSNGVEKVFQQSDLIVAASGTVTLQAAIHGVPMVIMYKVSPLSYWLGRALIRVKHIGLVNLVAGKELAPELVQAKASALNIASAIEQMCNDADGLNRVRQQLRALRHLLGGAGASERVADIAFELLGR
jgi:lipid-A-disaccharide synthase